jgi:hypothetical protein
MTTVTGSVSFTLPADNDPAPPTAAQIVASLSADTASLKALAAALGVSGVGPPPPPPPACAMTSTSWIDQSTGSGIYDYKQYGNYVVQADNWGNLPGQVTWANSEKCWGMTNTKTVNTETIQSYAHITRGWMESGALAALSTKNTDGTSTNDWTTKCGMGIEVNALTKAKVGWTFAAPPANGTVDGKGNRYDSLIDIYYHTSATPQGSEFPPMIDVQLIQSLADQVIGSTTFYAYTCAGAHATEVTIGGNTYTVFIDQSGGASFHQAGGHTIALFLQPTAFNSNNANPSWGANSAVHDVAAITKYFMQANPVDNAGKPLLFADGTTVTAPLIPPSVFLTAINAGWELDLGPSFTTTDFWVAMQGEPDGV